MSCTVTGNQGICMLALQAQQQSWRRYKAPSEQKAQGDEMPDSAAAGMISGCCRYQVGAGPRRSGGSTRPSAGATFTISARSQTSVEVPFLCYCVEGARDETMLIRGRKCAASSSRCHRACRRESRLDSNYCRAKSRGICLCRHYCRQAYHISGDENIRRSSLFDVREVFGADEAYCKRWRTFSPLSAVLTCLPTCERKISSNAILTALIIIARRRIELWSHA